VPLPAAATQLVVEPALVAAPSMNTAACPVEGDTNVGFRPMLCACAEGEPIVKVPLTSWSGAAPLGPVLEPLEQLESSIAVPMHITVF